MLRSADSLYCSRACTGRTGPGRTVLPPEQVTARRLCTCKSSHALVALTHVPFKKEPKPPPSNSFLCLAGKPPPLWTRELLLSTQSSYHWSRSPGRTAATAHTLGSQLAASAGLLHSAQCSLLLQATVLLSYLCTTQMVS